MLPAPAFPQPLAKHFLGAESLAGRVWAMETQVKVILSLPTPAHPQGAHKHTRDTPKYDNCPA